MAVIVYAASNGAALVVPAAAVGTQGPPGPAGSGSTIGIKNEGSLISTTVQRVNFTGVGKSVSGTGADVTIDIPGGSSGWAVVSVNDFGATGNGSTDDSAAFVAAIAALKAAAVNTNGFYKASAKLTALPGHYYLGTTTLDITHTFIFECDGTGMAGVSYPVKLRWAAGVSGIRVQRFNTSGVSTLDGVTHFGGDGSIFRGLHLVGGYAGTEGEFHGFHLKARAGIENCKIEGFQGDGIHVVATAGAGSPNEGNANLGYILGGSIQGCRNGIFFDGADSNIWSIIGLDVEINRRWGIYDSSFLGNSYFGCHADANGLVSGSTPSVVSYTGNRYAVKHGQETGASTNAPSGTTADNTWWYYISAGGTSPGNNINTWVSGTTYRSGGSYCTDDSGNAGVSFQGCYHEGGQGVAQLVTPTLVLGGSMSANVRGSACLIGSGPDIRSTGGLKADTNLTALGSSHAIGPQSGTAVDNLLTLYNTSTTSQIQFVRSGNAADGYLLSTPTTLYVNGAAALNFRVGGVNIATLGSTGVTLPADKALIGSNTAAPTTGTHARGEMVFNSAPSASGKVGWVCVTAGSPGTWKPFGAIDA